MKTFFYIQGMTCTACSSGIEKALKRKKGVQNIQVDLLNHSASLEFDPQLISLEEIFALINKLGYTPQKQGWIEKTDSLFLTPKRRIILALIFTSIAVLLSMLPMFAVLPIPQNLNIALQVLCALVVMHLGRNFYIKGLKSLFLLHPNMDSLVALGSGSAFVFSVAQIFSNQHFYFESVCVILTFILIGKTIEEKAKQNTAKSLQELIALQNQSVLRIQDQQEEKIPSTQIQVNDILKISPQEMILCEGTLIEGFANLDCSALNGESMPIYKSVGESIPSGALNLNTTFLMQVLKAPQDSTFGQILNLVQNTLLSKAPIAKLSDKIASVFVPLILCLALLSGLFWWIQSQDFELALGIFCSVVLISCPCALGLATPLALSISTKLASQKGIFFKDAQVLESLTQIQQVCFDKTGTLTKNTLQIQSIQSYSSLQEAEILNLCASLEKASSHIIAKSLLAYVKDPLSCQDVKIYEGFGISGVLQGITYKVGSAKLFSPQPTSQNESLEIFLGIAHSSHDEILGSITLKETLREEAKTLIDFLKHQKIQVMILSGDHAKSVQNIAKELDIDFLSNATPQDKLNYIQTQNQNIMMVGDGINDMLVLSKAKIGVSIGEGSKGAIASSNLILFNPDLTNLIYVFKLSKATLKNIKQNLLWAFGYNVAMIPIACGVFSSFGLWLNPMFASIAMTLSSLSVVLNAQRLKMFKGD